MYSEKANFRNLLKPKKIRLFFLETLLVLLTLFYLYPFYAVIVLSIKTPAQALMSPMSLPTSLELSNFATAWKMTNYPKAFFNSLYIVALSVFLIVTLSGMGSFSLSMVKNRFTGFLYYFFIAGLMIPFFLSLVPSVKLMKDLHLMDSLNGISLSYIGRNVAFAVFLFMGFIRSIPKEIGESAIVDGCRPFKLYWYIYFPMLKPVVTTLVILNAMSIWNDFLFPLLVLQTNGNRTLTLVQYIFRSEANTQWNLVFASYLLSMLPLMILYFALQKNIVEGIAAGAVKG